MAMNIEGLSSCISNELIQAFGLDQNEAPEKLFDFSDALAKAIVVYIKVNAEVNSDTGKIE